MTSGQSPDGPLPLGKLLVGLSVLIIFGLYALTTLLYVLPSNPLRIYFDTELSKFEKWGYQRWTFFAPPPRHNDRLYFAFSPKSGDGFTVEVLQGIYARKQQDNPRNIKAQVVDYMLSSMARQVADQIREVYRYRKVNELLGGDSATVANVAKTVLADSGPYGGRSVRILLRYAAMVAQEQGIELDGLKCQIAYARLPLRPFSQRYNIEFPIEEEISYRTAIFAVPRL